MFRSDSTIIDISIVQSTEAVSQAEITTLCFEVVSYPLIWKAIACGGLPIETAAPLFNVPSSRVTFGIGIAIGKEEHEAPGIGATENAAAAKDAMHILDSK